MVIARRQDLEDALYKELIESFDNPLPPALVPGEQGRRGSEVHLSDLMNPRQAAFKRLIPQPVTRREANLFMTGRGFEFDLSRRCSMRPGVSQVIEGISMRPDFSVWPGHWIGPIEVKWRRANLAMEGAEAEEYENYLDQLRGYCSLLTVQAAPEVCDQGLLIVATPRQGQVFHDALKPTEPAIHVYQVSFTLAELADGVQVLRLRRDAFTAALESRNPTQVPLCYDFLCGTRVKVVIHKPYCLTCEREFDTEYGIDKHTKSKTGAGHNIQHEVVRWDYEARCRWYSFCQPEKIDPNRGGTA